MKVHRRLSTTIGGSVGAVDDFLDDAAPHKHFSMNYQARESISTHPRADANKQTERGRTWVISASLRTTEQGTNANCLNSVCEMYSACTTCTRPYIRSSSSLSTRFSRAERDKSACTTVN
jgi:hypothetical protein